MASIEWKDWLRHKTKGHLKWIIHRIVIASILAGGIVIIFISNSQIKELFLGLSIELLGAVVTFALVEYVWEINGKFTQFILNTVEKTRYNIYKMLSFVDKKEEIEDEILKAWTDISTRIMQGSKIEDAEFKQLKTFAENKRREIEKLKHAAKVHEETEGREVEEMLTMLANQIKIIN